jgi:hypothetical protein
MENLSAVTCGAPINKYAQITPFTDGVLSFFQILNDFYIRKFEVPEKILNLWRKKISITFGTNKKLAKSEKTFFC